MNAYDVAQFLLFILLLVVLTPIVGGFIARVLEGHPTFLSRPLAWLERLSYRAGGIDPHSDMDWKEYAAALVVFNVIGLLVVLAIQLFQATLPLNPENLPAVSWHLAVNTAVSFVTNTNWQSYTPENTMSFLTQMMALAVQNFASAAVGLAAAVALARGIARRSPAGLGNFWADLVRSTVYVLLPLSFVFAVVLIGQGVVQNFTGHVTATTLEGAAQVVPTGPAASQVAIKMIGTNGGGFFNANAAHPFENPTPLSNFLQMLAIFLIPAGLTFAFGSLTGARRHGWVLFGTMLALFVVFTAISLASENAANPILGPSALMEGKETRFGVFNSVFFSTVTTSASCGAVNAMHSSLSPLSGGIAMLNMMLGEIIFGGVGAGLYGMLLFVLLTVFIAGLMVGRTPEYLGKKIEAREMTMVILAILAPCASILVGTGLALVIPAGRASLVSAGPHGLSEMLYAFTSAAANNGSAFAGINANTVFMNLSLALAMLIGRFAITVPILAVGGSLARKKYSPPSVGTFETDSPLFAVLLIGVILIVGALTFVPALSLGPVVEHFLMLQGQTF